MTPLLSMEPLFGSSCKYGHFDNSTQTCICDSGYAGSACEEYDTINFSIVIGINVAFVIASFGLAATVRCVLALKAEQTKAMYWTLWTVLISSFTNGAGHITWIISNYAKSTQGEWNTMYFVGYWTTFVSFSFAITNHVQVMFYWFGMTTLTLDTYSVERARFLSSFFVAFVVASDAAVRVIGSLVASKSLHLKNPETFSRNISLVHYAMYAVFSLVLIFATIVLLNRLSHLIQVFDVRCKLKQCASSLDAENPLLGDAQSPFHSDDTRGIPVNTKLNQSSFLAESLSALVLEDDDAIVNQKAKREGLSRADIIAKHRRRLSAYWWATIFLLFIDHIFVALAVASILQSFVQFSPLLFLTMMGVRELAQWAQMATPLIIFYNH